MRVKRLFIKVERHFSPGENSTYNQRVRGENALKDTPQRKSLRIKKCRSLPQEVKIINPENFIVASLVKERARMERFAMLSKTMTGSLRETSDGRHLQHGSETSASKQPAMVYIEKK